MQSLPPAVPSAVPPPPSSSSSSSSMHPPLTPNLSAVSLHSQYEAGGGSGGLVEPLDYEEFVSHQGRLGARDPCGHLLDFPADDIDVKVVPRKIRTMGHVLPEEAK